MLRPHRPRNLSATRNGADGSVTYANLTNGGQCCADPLCADLEGRICSFIDLLPSGPMWDSQKARVREWAAGGPLPDCPSMALYAAYLATVMQDIIDGVLIPALDKDNPLTTPPGAVDYWLERLGWQDCFRTACTTRFMLDVSPYACLTECGLTYNAPEQSEESLIALKYAIIRSLTRARVGGLRNLAWLNWVIEPLAAEISPAPWPDNVVRFIKGECDDTETPCFCEDAQFEICPIEGQDLLYPHGACDAKDPLTATPWATFKCPPDDSGETYPVLNIHTGVAAAQCIVQAVMRRKCPTIITRCEAAVTTEE